MRPFLQVFDVSYHLVCFKELVDQHQSANDVADRSSWRISDPGMNDPRRMQAKKILILSEEDSAFSLRARSRCSSSKAAE